MKKRLLTVMVMVMTLALLCACGSTGEPGPFENDSYKLTVPEGWHACEDENKHDRLTIIKGSDNADDVFDYPNVNLATDKNGTIVDSTRSMYKETKDIKVTAGDNKWAGFRGKLVIVNEDGSNSSFDYAVMSAKSDKGYVNVTIDLTKQDTGVIKMDDKDLKTILETIELK